MDADTPAPAMEPPKLSEAELDEAAYAAWTSTTALGFSPKAAFFAGRLSASRAASGPLPGGEREAVRFAASMERELHNNRHKGDFSDWRPTADELRAEIEHHLTKLIVVLKLCNKEAVEEYAADIGNFCLKAVQMVTPPSAALSAPPPPAAEPYQARVGTWMDDVFAAGGADLRTRIDRYLEESFELAQALDYDPGRIAAIRDYVFGRPVGVASQETGGVMVTLASLCHAAGIDMAVEGERELARVHTPEARAKIMAKQASKNALHTPLPTAEAADAQPGRAEAKELREATTKLTRPLAVDSMDEAVRVLLAQNDKRVSSITDEQWARHLAWVIGFDTLVEERARLHALAAPPPGDAQEGGR